MWKSNVTTLFKSKNYTDLIRHTLGPVWKKKRCRFVSCSDKKYDWWSSAFLALGQMFRNFTTMTQDSAGGNQNNLWFVHSALCNAIRYKIHKWGTVFVQWRLRGRVTRRQVREDNVSQSNHFINMRGTLKVDLIVKI